MSHLQLCAKQAFELNAGEDIADICDRFSSDPEVFSLSMSSLTALATVPKAVKSFLANPTASLTIKAVRGYFNSLEFNKASLPDDIERLYSGLKILAALSKGDALAFDLAGGTSLLLDLATMATCRGVPIAAYPIIGPAVAYASAALDRGSRTKAGLDALTNPVAVGLILQLATTNLNSPTEGVGKAKLKRLSTMIRSQSFKAAAKSGAQTGKFTPVKGSGNNSSSNNMASPGTPGNGGGSGSAGSAGENNAHLEPAFRILDRLARGEQGRELLVNAGATEMLTSIMKLTSRNKSLEALATRVLAHLLGRDINSLIDRLAGELDGQAIPMNERVLAARLLSSLMLDEENRSQMLKNDGALLLRILELLNDESLSAPLSDASAPMIQALTRIAGAKSEHIVSIVSLSLGSFRFRDLRFTVHTCTCSRCVCGPMR